MYTFGPTFRAENRCAKAVYALHPTPLCCIYEHCFHLCEVFVYSDSDCVVLYGSSNTTRHLAEFQMVEPELAFADMKVRLQEGFLINVIVCGADGDGLCRRLHETCSSVCPASKSSMSILLLFLPDMIYWSRRCVVGTKNCAEDLDFFTKHYDKTLLER